jgi:hypothetical protein
LEPWHDGVIVHWFLRARSGELADATRIRRAYSKAFKRHVTALKDELERGRLAGLPRGET